jgi:hypothetical protein
VSEREREAEQVSEREVYLTFTAFSSSILPPQQKPAAIAAFVAFVAALDTKLLLPAAGQ